MKNHDGWITVDSELGKGTIVHIYLPAMSIEIKEQEPEEVKEPKGTLAMGEGTILVIEDEPVLLKMTKEILERLGYRALEAKTGREGKVLNFTMNDKCAAGTGRFLEVMAAKLEITLEDLGKLSLSAKGEVATSSVCTVFSESEIVSLFEPIDR